MLEKNDPAAGKLIRNGMLVEHDLARYHVGELEIGYSCPCNLCRAAAAA